MTWAIESTAAYQYLHDVLGMRWIKATFEQPKVVVVAGASVPSANRALIERMMSAVGIRNFTIVAEPIAGPGVGLVMNMAEAQKLGLGQPGQATQAHGRRWMLTLEPQLLLEGEAAQVTANKRMAWAHIQELSQWLREAR